MARLLTALRATVIALTLTAAAPHLGDAQVTQPSKIADSVHRVLNEIDAGRVTADLSALSNPLVHVSRGGKVELVFHARASVGRAEVAELPRSARTSSPRSRRPA